MYQNKRSTSILELLQFNNYVNVETLSKKLGVSTSTIRRDLTELEEMGLVTRTHGGAITGSSSTSYERPISVKRLQMMDVKRSIGRVAADLVNSGDTVILDAGTTTREVANCLEANKKLIVVSNDLNILMLLSDKPNFTVVDPGGGVRKGVYSLMGAQTVSFLNTLRVNWTFLGADAIHPVQGITNVNLDEVPVKNAMINAGVKVVVVADHTKFGNVVFASVCSLQSIDMIVTDDGLDKNLADTIREKDVELIITPSAAINNES